MLCQDYSRCPYYVPVRPAARVCCTYWWNSWPKRQPASDDRLLCNDPLSSEGDTKRQWKRQNPSKHVETKRAADITEKELQAQCKLPLVWTTMFISARQFDSKGALQNCSAARANTQYTSPWMSLSQMKLHLFLCRTKLVWLWNTKTYEMVSSVGTYIASTAIQQGFCAVL